MKIFNWIVYFILISNDCSASLLNDSCFEKYKTARNLLSNGMNAEAIYTLEASIKNGCTQSAIYNLIGCSFMTLTFVNDDTNNLKAIRHFDVAIKQDSSNPAFYNNRGWALQNLNKYKLALSDFKKAAFLDSMDVNYQGNVLRVLWILNKYKEAYSFAEELIKKFPEDGYAYHVRGNLKRDYLKKYPEGNLDIKKSELLKWRGGIYRRY